MNKYFVSKLKDNSGATLAFVLMILVVITLYIGIMSTLFQSNLMQAKSQVNLTKAYYLALSGTDLAMEALLQEIYPAEPGRTLLKDTFDTSISSPGPLTDTLTLDEGTIFITISADDTSGERWIVITSLGTLDSTGTKKTVTLEFNYANPLIQKKPN